MKIECVLKRGGGTRVDIDGINYHFAPLPDGAHVADVENKSHIKRFLSIPEAYELYVPDSAIPVSTGTTVFEPVAPQGNEQVALHGTSVHMSSFEINGRTYTLGDVVAKAHTASGLSVEDWNAMPEAGRADMIDAELDKLAADFDADRSDLVAKYQAKFGRKPHPATSSEKLRASIGAE